MGVKEGGMGETIRGKGGIETDSADAELVNYPALPMCLGGGTPHKSPPDWTSRGLGGSRLYGAARYFSGHFPLPETRDTLRKSNWLSSSTLVRVPNSPPLDGLLNCPLFLRLPSYSI